jgi:D-cysteine desulfhydrase/L-cysteate sulfo-lyase
MSLPYDQSAGKPVGKGAEVGTGNAVLDKILGVELRHIPDDDWEVLFAEAESVAEEQEALGRKVFSIPVGGSAGVGAYAFFEAGREVREQRPELEFDHIVFASSSGSTQTGLSYAFEGLRTEILGICSDPEPGMVDDFALLGDRLLPYLPGRRRLEPRDFVLDTSHVGPGYGVPSEEGWQAIELMARREGIFLDPVYTGKAFAGLLSHARSGRIKGSVLFWHTGGLPSLFAYPRA